jgi:hypothetical protein
MKSAHAKDSAEIDCAIQSVTSGKSFHEPQQVVCPRCSNTDNFYLCLILDRQKIWHELHCLTCRSQGSRSGDFITNLSPEEAEQFSEYLKQCNPEALSIRIE